MKFNKILSLVLAVGMLLSCMGNIAFADEAAVAEPTLVYDMDLTNYDIKSGDTGGCIPNSENKDAPATFTPGTQGSYRIQNMLNNSGVNVPVINFVKNNSTITFESTELANKSVTLEVWANIDLGTAGWESIMLIQGKDETNADAPVTVNSTYLAGYSATTSAYDYLLFAFQGQGSTQRAGTNARTIVNSKTNENFAPGEWHKFTLVRDMTAADSVTHSLYCDGILWVTDKVAAKANETSVSLKLCGLTTLDCFKIADVKLYKGVKDATSISTDYNGEAASYTEKPISESLVFDADMDSYFKNNPIPSAVELSDTAEKTYGAHYNSKNTKGSFIGANLDRISYVNSKDNNDSWTFKDTVLANKSYTVDVWLSVDTDKSYDVYLLEASGWDQQNSSVNKAIVNTIRQGAGMSKYTFGDTVKTGDTYINDDGTFIHLAITREFSEDGTQINVKYYLNGALKKEENLTAALETKAGWIIRGGRSLPNNQYAALLDLKIADVRLYGERVLDEAQIKALYTAEKDKYVYPTYTVTETCTIKDSEDAAITDPETQLTNGFKFSTGITSNAKAKTVVALYKNDTLYDYKVIEYNQGATIDATFDTVAYDATAAWKIKVMLLDGFTNLYPMTKAVTYENVFATAN